MCPATSDAPYIFVLGGVNGAGKSSVAGSYLRRVGLNYFNPDEATKRIQGELGCTIDEANSRAWQEGKESLEAAISGHSNFAFELTLGGDARTYTPARNEHRSFIGREAPTALCMQAAVAKVSDSDPAA